MSQLLLDFQPRPTALPACALLWISEPAYFWQWMAGCYEHPRRSAAQLTLAIRQTGVLAAAWGGLCSQPAIQQAMELARLLPHRQAERFTRLLSTATE